MCCTHARWRSQCAALRKALVPAAAHRARPPVGNVTHAGRGPLSRQVVLRAREAVARYYDGSLVADDETADVPGGCRSAVLRPSGEANRCAHPDTARQGVLLSRAVGERALYMQVSCC